MVGASSAVTEPARRPSATKMIRLRAAGDSACTLPTGCISAHVSHSKAPAPGFTAPPATPEGSARCRRGTPRATGAGRANAGLLGLHRLQQLVERLNELGHA